MKSTWNQKTNNCIVRYRGLAMRKLRYIEKGHEKDSLTIHEIGELYRDFDIETKGFYVLAPLTKEEWELIKSFEFWSKQSLVCQVFENSIASIKEDNHV